MPAFDMKNADFYILDGYGPTGFLVNLMAGYTVGATTMVVDGGTVALAVGDRFTIAGETGLPIHIITSHTETSMATTSITFAPGIASMVADDVVITVLPHLLHIKIGEGTMSYTEKRAIVYVKDRGRLHSSSLARLPLGSALRLTSANRSALTFTCFTNRLALRSRRNLSSFRSSVTRTWATSRRILRWL